MNFEIDWITLGLSVVGQTVILTAALWIMLKVQHFDWSTPGLIGAAAVACALDRIPFVGWELSFVVLLFCVKALIHSRTFTDAIFSVAIAYAITFAVNMFLLTALVGDLRHSVAVRARVPNPARAAAVQPAGTTSGGATTPPTRAQTATAQTPTATATTSDATEPVAPVPVPAANPGPAPAVAASTSTTPTSQPTPTAPTAPAANATPVGGATEPAPIQPTTDTNRLNSLRLAGDIMKHFYVKGVSQGATISIAMISNGTRNFDIVAGDIVQLETSDGRYVAVKCEHVGDGQVIVSVDGVKVTLFHR